MREYSGWKCVFCACSSFPDDVSLGFRDFASSLLSFLPQTGLAPEIPEDLYMLIKKAVAVRKHLERNRKDKDSKFRLILIESRIHRLARYYRLNRKLPPTWKYESSTASALVA